MNSIYKLRTILILSVFMAFSQSLFADTYYGPTRVIFSYDYLKGTIDMQYLELDEAGLDDELDRITIWYRDAGGNYVLLIDNGYNLRQWGGSINHPDMTYVNAPTSGDLRFRKYKWNKIPTNLLGRNIEFFVAYDWDIDDNDSWNGNYDGSFRKNVNALSIAAPSAMVVSTNECNQVNISWTNPDLREAPGADYEINIYRNDQVLNNVPLRGSPVSYTDNTVVDGLQYIYRTEAVLHTGKTVHRSTGYNHFGKSRPIPSGPMTIALTEDGCAGQVRVRWTIPSSQYVDKFIVERSTSNNFSNATSFDVSPSVRVYNDAVGGGTKYYYRVRAVNDCPTPEGISVSSDITPQFVNGDISLTDVLPISNGRMYVYWPSPCFGTSERFLKRTSTAGNVQSEIRIELPNNAVEYFDEEVLPCVRYSYKLVMKQASNGLQYISPGLAGNVQEDIKDALVDFDASKGYLVQCRI